MLELDSKYKALLEDVLENGTNSDDRTGVGTIAKFGAMLEVNLEDNLLPAITLRKVAPRIAFEELMFMLNGKSQTKELEDKGINIWKGNTSKEFQEKVGLGGLEEGDFGRMYGVQLREFSGLGEVDPEPLAFDQLEYMVEEIKNNPSSRRIIATHYNPAEADQGVLFPCHIITQFNVRGEYLDCLFWMRSSDLGYGFPINIMYYGMFCHLMAKLTGYKAGKLVYQAGDAHIYKDQIESGMIDYMVKDVQNTSLSAPQFIVNKDINSLEDMLQLTWEDVQIINYDPRPDFKNKPRMAV
jgi:thymidylate synthase